MTHMNYSNSLHTKEIEAFLTLDWNYIYARWKSRLDDFAIDLSSLFYKATLSDSLHPNIESVSLAWWDNDSIQKKHIELQEGIDKRNMLLFPDETNAGKKVTLDHLYTFKDEPEYVAALLICASLREFISIGRICYEQYYNNLPPYSCINLLYNLVIEKISLRLGYRFGWHHTSTYVLPWIDTSRYEITTLEQLIAYIAEEHACLLSQYKPVIIEFAPEKDPFINNILVEKYKKEAEENQEREKRWLEDKLKREQELNEKRRNHPRYDEWPTISKEELKKLVWQKPTSALALDFGVSDVAIGKRCKSLKINKPPRGYWAKAKVNGNRWKRFSLFTSLRP